MKHCISPRDEAAEKCPTRDASPPLEVAFGVRVRRMFTFYQTAIKTKVVQIAVNATYTAFYFDYQRYYT